MDDPDPGNIIFKLVLLLVLILINAFFAMSEIAIITLNDTKLKKAAEEGDKKSLSILKLTENPSGFLSTIQIGVTLAGFLTSASASESFSTPLANWLWNVCTTGTAATPAWLQSTATVLITILMSYFSLVLGELTPKRIAMQASEQISYKIVGILLFFKSLFKPVVKLLTVSTNLLVRMLGYDPNASEENVTEEEIRMMVDAGEEKGVIEESQKEMINNIFDFDDVPVLEVMTHRTEIEAVEISDKIEDVVKLGCEKGYSRIPVYEDELDNIKGILYVKDLLPYVGRSMPAGKKISRMMREANFVPESKRCGDLFKEMTEKHVQMMIVSDEYGAVSGLVTIEDLLESIVGNIQDEYDNEEQDIVKVNDTTFNFDGTTNIDEVEEQLDLKFPEGEYDTLGGFIMSELGHIPTEEEKAEVTFGGYSFKVLEVEERRIETVRAEKLPEQAEPENAAEPEKKD